MTGFGKVKGRTAFKPVIPSHRSIGYIGLKAVLRRCSGPKLTLDDRNADEAAFYPLELNVGFRGICEGGSLTAG